MKILFISMEQPYPDFSGGSKYSWQKIKQLSKGNDIYLISFGNLNNTECEKEYKKYVKEYYFYKRKKNFVKIICKFNHPYSMVSRINKDMQDKIKELVYKQNIDIILLDSIHMYYNILAIKKNIPVYLTQHNIEYKLFSSISCTTKSIIKKIIYKFESNKILNLEKKLFYDKRFKGYIFISYEDLKIYNNEIGNVNSICIPPCINKNDFTKKGEKIDNIIVFSGKMSYEPNVIAVNWFVKEIFPIITKEISDVKFYIVGKDPTNDVKKLESENVIVTGMVDDVKDYLNMAKIVVIPLLSGGGVKLKLFEALETDNIIITTDVGIQGTCFIDDKDLFVANTKFEFADKCIENLKNPNRKVVEQARKTLIENYSFEVLQDKILKFISE